MRNRSKPECPAWPSAGQVIVYLPRPIAVFMFPAPMGNHSYLSDIRAQFLPSLDPDFQPISLVLRQAKRRITDGTGAVELTFLLERLPGDRSVHRLTLPDPAHVAAGEMERLVERICKFLLWQQGASRVGIHSSDGSDRLAKRLRASYQCDQPGRRRFQRSGLKIGVERGQKLRPDI